MKQLALLFVLIATVFTATAQKKEKWRTLKSAEGEFRVQIPGEWKHIHKDFGSAEAPTTLHINEYNTDSLNTANNVRFAVSWADLQEHVNHDDHIAVQNVFDSQIERITNMLDGGIPVEDQVTRYEGNPGLDVELNYANDKGKIYLRMFLVHNRLYLLEVTGMLAQIQHEDLDRFFESLEIKF